MSAFFKGGNSLREIPIPLCKKRVVEILGRSGAETIWADVGKFLFFIVAVLLTSVIAACADDAERIAQAKAEGQVVFYSTMGDRHYPPRIIMNPGVSHGKTIDTMKTKQKPFHSEWK